VETKMAGGAEKMAGGARVLRCCLYNHVILSECSSVTVAAGDISEKQERVNDGEGQKRKSSVNMVEHDHQRQQRHDEKMAKRFLDLMEKMIDKLYEFNWFIMLNKQT